MQTYWIKFTDGSTGYVQGHGAYDAVAIAEHLTGKTVALEPENKWQPERSEAVKTNPYPVTNMIWKFEHPVHGKLPAFVWGAESASARRPAQRHMPARTNATQGHLEMAGLMLKYFVLKPKGSSPYSKASRAAMRAYADVIEGENYDLADNLRNWVAEEQMKSAALIAE